MIQISIPEPDVIVKGTKGYRDIPKNKGGFYIIYSEDKKPLYVGKTQDLKLRVYQHFLGVTNTAGYKDFFSYCEVFFESDEIYRGIYEFYLINKLNAPLNWKDKKGHLKNHYTLTNVKSLNERCNQICSNGKKCNNHANQNGYCRLHGGNGITKKTLLDKAMNKIIEEESLCEVE